VITRPTTIPALREWVATSGAFTLAPSPRVVVRPGDAGALEATGHTIVEDLRAATGASPVVTVDGEPGAGDLRLDLTADDDELGAEGYRLDVGDHVTISANAPAGAFYGSRTLLQLLGQSDRVSAGTARDWPRYPERGLMVDIGRKAFSAEWLAARIEEMAWLKLNLLHLHFTENMGWRIASDGHPEVVSEEHLTKGEVRELLALAARRHITVVPEIDAPGHMGAALRAHPELQLRDNEGKAKPNNLDYTLPEARQYLVELVEEYLDLFPGPYWHTGADEYLLNFPPRPGGPDYGAYPQLHAYALEHHGPDATPKDGILGLVNELNALVRSHGRTLRVWNDGLDGGHAVTPDPDIVVEWWVDLEGPSPSEVLAAGHRVMNCGYFPTYYINGFPGGPDVTLPDDMPMLPKPRAKELYQSWAPHRFHGPIFLEGRNLAAPQEIAADEERNLGAKLHIWNDDPSAATVEETAAGIVPYLRAMAQQAWGSAPLVASFAEFEPIIAEVGGP